MSEEIKKTVSRFKKKAQDLTWPDHIVDFESSNFCISGLKPLHDIEDEIKSSFIWCWSIKDHLKSTLYKYNQKLNIKDFSRRFENEINNFFELTLCADIANIIKHRQLNEIPRSGMIVHLDVKLTIPINKENTIKIQKLNNQYYITSKSNDKVKLKVNIVDADNKIVCDAFQCLEKAVESWGIIEHKFSGS